MVWNQREPQVEPPQSSIPQKLNPVRVSSRSNSVQDRPEVSKWHNLMNDALPRHTKLELARKIDLSLSSDDIDLLLGSLGRVPAAHAKDAWWVIMNEIMEQMRRKGVAADRLGGTLMSLIRDTAQPVVVRDYAVQHLALWVAPIAGAPGESSAEVRAEALELLSGIITDPSIAHTSIPGTAIMSLTVATRSLPSEVITPMWAKIDPSLSAMLTGEIKIPLGTQTTLIQALAMRRSEEHLPLVREMARDENINPSMRLSSIAALGIYQSELDQNYLSDLAQGSTRYRYAAQSALKRFQEKR